MADPGDPRIDFQNTEIAFSYKTDRQLRQAYHLFRFMNHPTLVRIGTTLGRVAARIPLGLADPIIEATIFRQFCGGTSLLNCQRIIDNLNKHKTLTILDYGVEAKENDEDFQKTLDENLKAIEFAYSNPNVPVISTKLTGYVPMIVLEKLQSGVSLNAQEQMQWQRLRDRFRKLCEKAHEFGVSIFVDAEESWIHIVKSLLFAIHFRCTVMTGCHFCIRATKWLARVIISLAPSWYVERIWRRSASALPIKDILHPYM